MVKKIVWSALIIVGVSGLAYPKLKSFLPERTSNSVPTAEVKNGTKAQEQNQPSSANKSGGKRESGSLQVSTYLVEPVNFVETISSTGTVHADEGVELQAETNGKVVSINFREGAPVKKGDLLVKLNDSDLQANLDRYNYGKQLSETRFRRISQLLERKVVTQDDYDNALNEVNVQQSFIDLYKAQIEKTEIRAPFDGVVGLRFVSVGAYVNANTRIATLQRLDELKIDFSVPERYSGRIVVGAEIQFTVAGGLNQYQGRVYAIDPRIDSGTRTLLIRAVCANTDSSLLPGAFTNVSVQLEEFPDALFVPAEAVIPGLEEKIVYVMKNGVAEMRAVQTGSRTATQVHILSGLQPGDLVITSGLQQIQPGLAVKSLQVLGEKKEKSTDTSQIERFNQSTYIQNSSLTIESSKLDAALNALQENIIFNHFKNAWCV